MSFVFHFYIFRLTPRSWTNPSKKGLNFEPFKMELIWELQSWTLYGRAGGLTWDPKFQHGYVSKSTHNGKLVMPTNKCGHGITHTHTHIHTLDFIFSVLFKFATIIVWIDLQLRWSCTTRNVGLRTCFLFDTWCHHDMTTLTCVQSNLWQL